jgi:sec-independent protein translocase protein TatA
VFGLGPLELVLIMVILLVLFGAKRLPQMGRDLGSGMREFKEGIVNPVDEVKQEFTNPMAGEKQEATRTPAALPRPVEAGTGGAPQTRDALPD